MKIFSSRELLQLLFRKLTAKQCAFICVFFWATTFVLTKYLLNVVDIKTLAVVRFFFITIILITLCIINKIKIPLLKDFPLFFIAGFCGYSLYMIMFNIANFYLSPSTTSVINALCPAVTALLAYFIFGEKIKFIGWISLGISFLGIIILTLWDGVFSINIGILYMLFACFLMSLYNITQRFLNKKYPSLKVSFYSMIFGGIQLFMYSPSSALSIFDMKLTIILIFIYMAVFPGIISYCLWTRAFSISKNTTEVTSFMFVTPILTTIMGIIFLGDVPKISTLIGGLLILIGMIIFNKSKI